MGWQLDEKYPTGTKPGPDTEISKGLRRHMPLGYNDLGAEREDGIVMAGAAFCIGLGALIVLGAVIAWP